MMMMMNMDPPDNSFKLDGDQKFDNHYCDYNNSTGKPTTTAHEIEDGYSNSGTDNSSGGLPPPLPPPHLHDDGAATPMHLPQKQLEELSIGHHRASAYLRRSYLLDTFHNDIISIKEKIGGNCGIRYTNDNNNLPPPPGLRPATKTYHHAASLGMLTIKLEDLLVDKDGNTKNNGSGGGSNNNNNWCVNHVMAFACDPDGCAFLMHSIPSAVAGSRERGDGDKYNKDTNTDNNSSSFLFDAILEEFLSVIIPIATDCYGYQVLQLIIQLGGVKAAARSIEAIQGNMILLALHK